MSGRSMGREQTKTTHWSSWLGVRIGLTTPFYKNKKETVTETATATLEANLVEEESSRVQLVKCTCESPREAGVPTTLLTTRTKTRIGTWNSRTLYETGKSAQVRQEMHRYNLKLLGLCDTRWTGTARTRLASGDTIIYSGQEEGQPHTHGVALLMTPEATRALMSWESVSPRILTARFNSKGRRVTIIQF